MAASIRSTSMPSRLHPISDKVSESLNQLSHWQSSPSTSSSSLCAGFSGLCDLYQSIDDLLQLPQTQQALVHRGANKCLDEVLEGSIRLLDACETARDVMLQVKGSLEDVQMTFRRRGTEADLQRSIKTYLSLKKSIKQKTIKCLKALKTEKCRFSSFYNGSQELVAVMTVVREASSTSITIMESLLSYFSASKPTGSVKTTAALKWIGSGRVACEEEADKMNEMKRLDAFLSEFYGQKSKKDDEQAWNAQERLKAFVGGMQDLEDGLNLVHRHLIQTRVSLLNILSQ
ncbi:uncharacterized protein [Aristolochia californica]|uniref:uncharacterized protein n=1 Tax=Aristolochia californica TaxID=171875 RepID=UPI0035D9DD51